MVTAHTRDAMEAYRRVEQALFTMLAMLEQENVQCARQPDVTMLQCVAVKLEAVEVAWSKARFIADADRLLAYTTDERETLRDVRYGGCQ